MHSFCPGPMAHAHRHLQLHEKYGAKHRRWCSKTLPNTRAVHEGIHPAAQGSNVQSGSLRMITLTKLALGDIGGQRAGVPRGSDIANWQHGIVRAKLHKWFKMSPAASRLSASKCLDCAYRKLPHELSSYARSRAETNSVRVNLLRSVLLRNMPPT